MLKKNSSFFFKRWKCKQIEPKTKLRWGIAPVSLIGDDFATALSVLPKEHHKLVACAACYKSHGEAFAKKHKVPKIFTSFYDFAKCKDIDVVYISPLNPFHLELGTLMLQNGKHVLCEKPLCINEDQAIQLVGKAHERGRFLMEAMWSRCTPAYQFIRERIRDCALGEIYDVDCTYGVPMLNLERVVKHSLGGGVTLDLGIYPIQLAQWAFRLPPYKITASGVLNSDNVDIEAKIEMDYSCGRTANISLSATTQYENIATIKGTKGELRIPEYWCPTSITDVDGSEKKFPLPRSEQETILPNRIALAYQAEEVRRCLLRKKAQSELMTHNESLLVCRIEDQIRRQIGVQFAEDDDNIMEFEQRH